MKRAAELERQTNYELRTFSSFKDELVDPEKVEKHLGFMPDAGERISCGRLKRIKDSKVILRIG